MNELSDKYHYVYEHMCVCVYMCLCVCVYINMYYIRIGLREAGQHAK